MAADGHAPEDGSEAGTTLVELLVVLALMSLIALFIGDGIAAVRRMTPIAGRIDARLDLAAAREHLRGTIGEAIATLPLIEDGAPFEGEPDALRFLAPADPLLEVGGLNEITLALEPGESGGRDLVEHRRIDAGDLSREGSRTVLVAGIRTLRLRYAAAAAGSLDWRDTWAKVGRPPALVALDLDFPPGDRRRFAPLLVHPMASPAPVGASARTASSPPLEQGLRP